MTGSLIRRIVLLSIFWITLALVVTGFVLSRQYRTHIEEHFDNHVFSHVEELVGALDVQPDGSLQLLHEPSDPRFARLGSGWYWEVLANERSIFRSASLGEDHLDLAGFVPETGHGPQILTDTNGNRLRAHVIRFTQPNYPGELAFVATAPQYQIADDVRHFGMNLALSFAVLAIGLSFAVVMQVRVALKPLKAIRREISDIKSGNAERLSQDFPGDVQPLVDELNFLLDHNEMLLKRARNQLGDLAHAVKNPLTVIRNEARALDNRQGQLILEQTHIMAGHIDHYLSRARIYGKKDAIGFRTSVRSVVEDIAYAVGHIHKDRAVEVKLLCIDDRWFRGEAQDLEEMAGNLLDNACKWAEREVNVSCSSDGSELRLIIEDDGPGIDEAHRDEVLHRGRKLDDSQPGHGQGLGIVQDIARLYGGGLELDQSASLGGLRVTLKLPSA